MSSHHIVRDDQEPALFILEPFQSSDYLNQLLEWSPTVLVAQAAIDFVARLGIKIDVAICEGDNVDDFKLSLAHQQPVKFLSYRKGEEPLVEGILYLAASNYPAVHVFSSPEPKLLKLLPSLATMNFTVSDTHIRWMYCNTGQFKKWVEKDKIFVIIKNSELSLFKTNSSVVEEQGENGNTKIKIQEEGFFDIDNAEQPFWLGEYIH